VSDEGALVAPPPPAPPPAGPVLQTTLVSPPPPWSAGDAPGVRVGTLIDHVFSTWRGGLLPFLGLGALYQAVNLALAWALGSPVSALTYQPFQRPGPELVAWTFSGRYWAFMGATLLLAVLFMGALTNGAIQRLAGSRVTVGGMLSSMLRRAPTLLGGGALAWLASYLGLILLIVPGVMWGLSFSLVAPVVMAERLGAVASLKRSAALARGSRWALLGAYLVCAVVASLPGFLALGLGFLSPILGGLVSIAGTVVLGPILYAAPAVAYHDLRVAREGAATAELARVFE